MKPIISLGVDLAAEVTESITALATHPEVYCQDHTLVTIRGTKIRPLTKHSIVTYLASAADFQRFKRKEDGWEATPAVPSGPLGDRVKDWGHYDEVRELEGITTTPVLRTDGTIVNQPGYDQETRLVYVPDGEPPDIVPNPTVFEAEAAVETLLDVVDEVPFARPSDRSAWLALVLTLVGKSLLKDNAPLFAAIGNQRRIGKTRLISYAEIIALGTDAGASRWPKDDDEVGKKVDSAVWEQRPLMLFDNIRGEIKGTALEAAVTSSMYTLRALGWSKLQSVPQNTVFAVTAHGASFGGDMSARTLPIRLFWAQPNPESRTFRRPNLKLYILEHRRELHAAALTILSAYLLDGAPDMGLPRWGSYEGWSDLIRNALVWAGQVDPLDARDGIQEEDAGDQAHDRLIAFIDAMMPDWNVQWTAGDLADLFCDESPASTDLSHGWTVADARDLAASLDVWDIKARCIDRKRLAMMLRGCVDRPSSDGRRIALALHKSGKVRRSRTNSVMYELVSS